MNIKISECVKMHSRVLSLFIDKRIEGIFRKFSDDTTVWLTSTVWREVMPPRGTSTGLRARFMQN